MRLISLTVASRGVTIPLPAGFSTADSVPTAPASPSTTSDPESPGSANAPAAVFDRPVHDDSRALDGVGLEVGAGGDSRVADLRAGVDAVDLPGGGAGRPAVFEDVDLLAAAQVVLQLREGELVALGAGYECAQGCVSA